MVLRGGSPWSRVFLRVVQVNRNLRPTMVDETSHDR